MDWISTKDRLPDQDDPVLVYQALDDWIGLGHLSTCFWTAYGALQTIYVTHWHPIDNDIPASRPSVPAETLDQLRRRSTTDGSEAAESIVNLIATRLLPDEVHQFQRQQRLALGDVQDAILTVGRGRGFIVQPRLGLYPEVPVVLTAAHCLPHLPPSSSFRMEERTYPRLLGPLDSSEPSIWAECVFVDPIADIAVLGEPDERNLHEECLAYRELVGNRPAVPIGLIRGPRLAWLFGRDGQWSRCHVNGSPLHHQLWIQRAPTEGIEPGTSGSPIVLASGHAVGIISTGRHVNPMLTDCLPGWLLAKLSNARWKRRS
jgi:hypothetical protein